MKSGDLKTVAFFARKIGQIPYQISRIPDRFHKIPNRFGQIPHRFCALRPHVDVIHHDIPGRPLTVLRNGIHNDIKNRTARMIEQAGQDRERPGSAAEPDLDSSGNRRPKDAEVDLDGQLILDLRTAKVSLRRRM